jgi:hypothetical protein
MTICWHADKLFMGHCNPVVIMDLLQWLSNCYSTADKKEKRARGHRHDYLGINILISLQRARLKLI